MTRGNEMAPLGGSSWHICVRMNHSAWKMAENSKRRHEGKGASKLYRSWGMAGYMLCKNAKNIAEWVTSTWPIRPYSLLDNSRHTKRLFASSGVLLVRTGCLSQLCVARNLLNLEGRKYSDHSRIEYWSKYNKSVLNL